MGSDVAAAQIAHNINDIYGVKIKDERLRNENYER